MKSPGPASATNSSRSPHRSMMVGARFGFGVNNDGARPQFLRARAGVGYCGRSVHSGCLRCVDVQLVRMDNANAIEAPSGLGHAWLRHRSPPSILEGISDTFAIIQPKQKEPLQDPEPLMSALGQKRTPSG